MNGCKDEYKKLDELTALSQEIEEMINPESPQTKEKSRRDYFAAAALQGLLAHYGHTDSSYKLIDFACINARKYADELIKQLDGGGISDQEIWKNARIKDLDKHD